MVRMLDKFILKKNPYARADARNPEGFPSFTRSREEAYLQVLLTNTLGGTFYADEKGLFEESLRLHREMAQTDPAFMARAIVYARREGLMRLQPIVGLAFLAKADRALFAHIFHDVILTPGDLADFVEIVRGGVVPGGMGRAIKTAVNSWLNGLSEYHAVKYAAGGQGYSLRDILRVSHPKPLDAARDSIFLWLTDTDKWLADDGKRALAPQIDAFERLKRLDLSGGQEAARQTIREGRLPYEVVTGAIKPDAGTWRELAGQMPYLALLRHLNTLQRAGVLADGDTAQAVAGKLRDREIVERVRVLPFQIMTAYRMFEPKEGPERMVAEALADALEASFVNLPAIPGAVCIAPDVSGSMSGHLAKMGKTTFGDVAGLFAAALFKASASALVLPFREHVVEVRLNQRDSLMTLAGQIAALVDGGTAVSAPVSRLLDRKVRVETFIGVTDNIEWATDQAGRTGFLSAWREYKERIAPNARAFLVTLAPYRHAVAPESEQDVFYIYGWNDAVLKFISMAVEGPAKQVEAVRALDLRM